MPKLSDDTLFARALPLAIQDRLALAGCYDEHTPLREEALAEAKAFIALKGMPLDELDKAQESTAFQAFVCAELWESSLADANVNADRTVFRDCTRSARLFREARLRRWGQTRLEHDVENSVSVDIRTLAERARASTQSHK
jgi:hypothetical protein